MTYNRGYGAGGSSSVIDAGSYFNGVYRSPGDLRVEGEFEGEIHLEGTLTIAETARTSGTVSAGNVTVSGQLQGQINCAGRFEILATGQVSAEVLAGTVIVRDGAFYEGEMRMHAEPAGLPARERTVDRSATPRPDLSAVAAPANGQVHADDSALQAVSE